MPSIRGIQRIPTYQGLDGFKDLCILVLWTKVAARLDGLDPDCLSYQLIYRAGLTVPAMGAMSEKML